MSHRESHALPVPILIEPPAGELVSLADCKAALGITGTDQDAALTMALDAAIDTLDAGTNGTLGRALRPQTWELQLESFAEGWRCRPRHYRCGGEAIALNYPPLIGIVSIKYLDTAGVEQALALNTDYRLLRVGAIDGRQLVEPAYGKCWPVARCDAASVRIRYECGYDGADNVAPRQLINAIALGARALLTASTRDPMLFEDRVEGIGSQRYQSDSKAAQIVTDAAASLLSSLRVF
ncbi:MULTISPECIES: phage head-tail connector protein [unclassified Bradyrhizobium]